MGGRGGGGGVLMMVFVDEVSVILEYEAKEHMSPMNKVF